MKNPNRYGSVTRLSGNRRKPWVVREGKSGQQKPIGYTATREDGLILLAKFNATPWDIEADKITLDELYKLWLANWVKLTGHPSNQPITIAPNWAG